MAKSLSGTFSEEREKQILDLLARNGRATVNEISDMLGISSSTTRIQLQQMHDKGVLVRTHGGAVKIDILPDFAPRKIVNGITNGDKKLQIAIAAADTIKDGDFIAISSGSTSLLLATLLHDKKRLTVVTDSVLVAHELLFDRNIKLYICGGEVLQRNSACIGPKAEAFLNSLKVEKSYASVDSINLDFGITSLSIDPRSEKALCKCGQVRYILADSTKIQARPFMEKVLDFSEIDFLISDPSLSRENFERIEQMGVKVIIIDSASADE